MGKKPEVIRKCLAVNSKLSISSNFLYCQASVAGFLQSLYKKGNFPTREVFLGHTTFFPLLNEGIFSP